jgi:6-phosphofructokinase 1
LAKLDANGNFELFPSPLLGDNIQKDIFGGSGFLPKDAFINNDSFVTSGSEYHNYLDIANAIKFTKAGPRADNFCNPKMTKACIVTCGGLCPGLNVVIRELFMTLHYNYEVKDIFGIKWGYKGFYTDIENNWIKLTPELVKNIHKEGGTILGSSRGGFDADKILDSLQQQGIT